MNIKTNVDNLTLSRDQVRELFIDNVIHIHAISMCSLVHNISVSHGSWKENFPFNSFTLFHVPNRRPICPPTCQRQSHERLGVPTVQPAASQVRQVRELHGTVHPVPPETDYSLRIVSGWHVPYRSSRRPSRCRWSNAQVRTWWCSPGA